MSQIEIRGNKKIIENKIYRASYKKYIIVNIYKHKLLYITENPPFQCKWLTKSSTCINLQNKKVD